LQAALASALCFACGAALPLLIASVAPAHALLALVSAGSLACLLLLGSVAARAGDARMIIGALRIGFWGALAMAITAGIGTLLGHTG
jgi:VIT1/CCC1 family predicted Fe2+/Mn2+ transporter